MITFVLISVLTQPYEWMPSFEKMCLTFYIIHLQKKIWSVIMGVRKINNQKNGTMLYVIMFNDGRGLAHCNAQT